MSAHTFPLSLFAAAILALAACSQTETRRESPAPSPPAERDDAPGVLEQGHASTEPRQEASSDALSTAAAQPVLGDIDRRAKATEPARKSAEAAASGAEIFMQAPPPPAVPAAQAAIAEQNRENYAHTDANPVQRVSEQPVSTFSVDVDTASYANLRRLLNNGQLPPSDAVRVEEMVNYFDYGYAPPRNRNTPFAVMTEMAPTPWNAKTHLLHVGIQGWVPDARPVGSNLVFLVDVSGSMQDPDKLPLVKTALKMLVKELGARDRISLVVYAGASGVVLEPTSGEHKAAIDAALDRLEAGGSTNGAAGIELAYSMAKQGWIEGGVNRVLLATDGDFNVGVTRFESLLDLVKDKRRTGIALTTLGFGQGNYNDHLMEQLADAGDGNNAYIDSTQEAYKVLVRQRESTLTTIARDVKIQVEFNPATVAEYRLIGYENRMLRREDFSNDAVDAGDIGAGHTVTALYEVSLVGGDRQRVQALRYGKPEPGKPKSGEIAHLRLRYKRPEDGVQAASRLTERPLYVRDIEKDLASASPAFRLSSAVAAFGQMLAGGVYLEGFDYTAIERLAHSAGEDRFGERAEFLGLVRRAGNLAGGLASGDVQIGG